MKFIPFLFIYYAFISSFPTVAQGYYDGITIDQAYTENYKKEITSLQLRVDKSFTPQFFKCDTCSISDFKKLKTLTIIVDYPTISSPIRQFKTEKQHVKYLNKWLNNLDSMENSIEIILPSTIVISPHSYINVLHIYHNSRNEKESYDLKNFNSLKNITLESSDTSNFELKNILHCNTLESISFCFSSIQSFIIPKLPENINKIEINGVKIEEVNLESIANLPKLQSLDLKTENLGLLDIKRSGKNITLQKLSIESSKIQTFNLNVLSNFPNLKSLHLGMENLETINLKELDANSLLNTFSIKNSRIKNFNFNDLILNLNLKEIYLEMDSLTEIIFPNSIFDSLENIGIISNKLENLPDNFNMFSNIRTFYTVGSTLNSISDDLFKATSLEYLSLSSTALESIPKQLFNLKNLFVLKLGLLKLDYDINDFDKLKNLEYVTITSEDTVKYKNGTKYNTAYFKQNDMIKTLEKPSQISIGRRKKIWLKSRKTI